MTCILNDLEAGRREAADQLLPLVYDQLRAIAQQRMNDERAGHTLQATALVHEAYLRLVGDEHVAFKSRAHFYTAAVEAMRLGASNYLIKPIQVELLRAVLAEGATKRRMLRQHREMTQSVKKSNEANEYTESIHEYNEEAQIKVILEAAAWKSEHQADKQQMGRRRCHLGRGDWNGSTIVH
ncbi:MAG: hypothetical protein IH888_05490 [Planctomycetes bacterium]|nr:hypothetical protein [Planctomycetota bacterium]